MGSISSVQDPVTGSNYGGISKAGSGVNASYQEYLGNLMETVKRPVGGPMNQEQYTPSGGRSPVIGQISTPSLGSTPIFGSGAALFPMAVLDQHAQAKKDAELAYLKEIGDVDMDTLKMEATLKNPWHNQAFNQKFMNAQDAWLNTKAQQMGGNYMDAMKSLKYDRDYVGMMKSYQDYADIYNNVFDNATEVLSSDPNKKYYSPQTRKMAQSFIHDYENLDDLPIDEMVKRARNFKSYTATNEIATNAMAGIGDRIFEDYVESSEMGTDAKTAWIKKTQKGIGDKELRELYDAQLKKYPHIAEDPVQKELLWTEMKLRADRSYEEAMTTIDKDTADETSYMKKNGIQTDKNGKVALTPTTPTAFSMYDGGKYSTGIDAITYPKRDMSGKDVTVTTPVGAAVHLIGRDGNVHRVSLPKSFDMVPKKEYTLKSPNTTALGGREGRHVEGTVYIEEEGLYSREYTKSYVTEDKDGNKTIGTEPTDGRTAQTTEKVPLRVKDMDTGYMVDLHGSYQIIAAFDDVEDDLNISYPFLKRTHADMKNTEQSRVIRGETTGAKAKPTAAKEPYTGKIPRKYTYTDINKAGRDKDSWDPGLHIKIGEEVFVVKDNGKLRRY